MRYSQTVVLLSLTLCVFGLCSVSRADERQGALLGKQFTTTIKPFLKKHCFACHGEKKQEAKLQLNGFAGLKDVTKAYQVWDLVAERLADKEMPPADVAQPTSQQRVAIVQWIRAVRKYEAERNAGDPGPVLPRRLSNAEYNYSIRDLTGVDIRPTREFPVDPANAAGFDNSGESLTMSPALARKYLSAAREVAGHLVLTPSGISFAPHPARTNTDRDKYCVKRIVEFYQRQPTDFADYFFASWQFKHREKLRLSTTTLADLAKRSGLGERYLKLVWQTLTDSQDDVGPLQKLRGMWKALPDTKSKPSVVRDACGHMRDFVVELRRQLEPTFPNLSVVGSHKGSQTFVLWKNRQYAAYRRRYSKDALVTDPKLRPGGQPRTDLSVPEDPRERKKYEAAFARFVSVFPNAFYISERGRDYVGKPKNEQEKGRLLSAGFHSMMGYFRDDRPLYDLILSSEQQRELDDLWRELDFVTSAPLRQYTGFVWFERTDSKYMRDPVFDFARAEDKDVTSQNKIRQLSKVYLDKARRNGGGRRELKAVEDYFININRQIRQVEKDRELARPLHLRALLKFAGRAFRRPLTTDESRELREFYLRLREQDQLTHEEAVEDLLVSILMSPNFCFRVDLGGSGTSRRPLTDQELASRLSYFLWSSIPDQRLQQRAREGRLRQRDGLLGEARRMLKDERVRGLASEFAGNWLDFRRFEEHNSVDRRRFPSFTDELRQAMFEEPLRFFLDVVRSDRSVLSFLSADHTFVNATLAKHYGLPQPATGQWKRVDQASKVGRGGLLPMSVFLTKNAPGLRTSPVKRGYWVVRRVLGEHIPAPPPNVPELPADEAKLGELTLPQVLARHREHKSCAGCHDRFDSIGLIFESYGPIGERRQQDLGGRPVTKSATFPNGSRGTGLKGLQQYLLKDRKVEFVDNLCRKLLSYALGRSLILSDEALLRKMRQKLVANDYRFGSLIETIVTSSQFLHKRGQP